jgi:hypothetical protein
MEASQHRLGLLLPIKSDEADSWKSELLASLSELASSLFDTPVSVFLGIDSDDIPLLSALPDVERALAAGGGATSISVTHFDREATSRPPGAICWLWGELAEEAMSAKQPPTVLLLLGE